MPLQNAILGPARLGNVRLGYLSAATVAARAARAALRAAAVSIQLAGVDARIRVAGLTIRDVANDNPNTCSLTIDGGESPVVSQTLRVSLGLDAPRLLFNGSLQEVGLSYELKPTQLAWPANALDDTPRANRRRPFGTWTAISATTVAQYLVAVFAPGFTSVHVQAGLPAVSIILDGSEGMNGALKQITDLIGGYFYWEDGDLHLFLTEATGTPDALDATPGRFLDDPPITATVDNSQLRTRVFGKGHGEALLADVLAGETILPVANAAAWFGTVGSGGHAIAIAQVLAYTGVQLAGGGSLVGPGAAPSTAPSLALAGGTGLGLGDYRYVYTDVTAAGESLPSPIGGPVTTVAIAAPSSGPTLLAGAYTDPPRALSNGHYQWAMTFVVTGGGETTASPLAEDAYDLRAGGSAHFNPIPLGPPGTTARNLYRTVAGGSQLKLALTVANNVDTACVDGLGDGSLGANVPTVNTAQIQRVTVTGIAIGASPTTARKLYRTAVNGSQPKLLATIADNTTTTYADSTADGSLGANVPTSDASGISFAGGQVNAGSTTILLASAGPFATGGGWTTTGVRYTGITGNTLTGVPAAGPGALLTTLLYGSQIVPAACLTGVTGLTAAILKGTPINVWVQRDDLTAQAEQAARDGSDGIVEAAPITDERRGEASLIAICDATLARYSRPLVTVTYACRDVKTKSGKPITIDLTSPPIHQTLTIQDVTIDQIDVAPGTLPRFSVTASSVRQSLDGLLRQLLAAAA